jgi:hypothetical protein
MIGHVANRKCSALTAGVLLGVLAVASAAMAASRALSTLEVSLWDRLTAIEK